MKIGNVELKNAIALAPMAGVTDLPFRLLCKEQGCGLMYTEMVSAKALLYKNRNTKPLLETRPEEEPVAVEPQPASRAASTRAATAPEITRFCFIGCYLAL